MAGWTTAETMVNYFLVVQDYAPDIVIIHEAPNDVDPRRWPGFRTDYSHYRKPWSGVQYSLPYRLLVRWSDLFAASQLRNPSAFDILAVVNRPPTGTLPRNVADRLPAETAVAFRRNVRPSPEHARLRGGRVVLATVPYDRWPPRRRLPQRHRRAQPNPGGRWPIERFTLAYVDARGRAPSRGTHPFFLDTSST